MIQHSFPTRRSSNLRVGAIGDLVAIERDVAPGTEHQIAGSDFNGRLYSTVAQSQATEHILRDGGHRRCDRHTRRRWSGSRERGLCEQADTASRDGTHTDQEEFFFQAEDGIRDVIQ